MGTNKNTVYILFLLFNFLVSSTSAKIPEKDKGRLSVVVIDPGHGGRDSGTIGGNVEEKNVVLDIALKLGRFIEEEFPEVKVVYTRKTDVFIPLNKRAQIANQADADLFISIHANSVDQKYVYGTETFVLGQHRSDENLEVAKKENSVILLEDDYNTTYEGFNPNSSESYIMFELVQDEYKGQSISMANQIQNEFRDLAKRKDRSVKEAGFVVLSQTSMPGVLIETGFLSNTTERNYLTSENGQTKLAQAIFRAFKAYKADVEQKSSFHMVAEDVAPQPVKREVLPTDENETNAGKTESELGEQIDLSYSVQIMALKRKLAPTPANFNGLQNVFRIEGGDLNRYFSGRYSTEALAEKQRKLISKEYPGAFVVAFYNNQLISVKKALELVN